MVLVQRALKEELLQHLTITNSALYYAVTVTLTVTEALVLHSLLEDRGRITESIRILVPVNRMKQTETCFDINAPIITAK